MEFQNILGEKSRVAVAKKACRGAVVCRHCEAWNKPWQSLVLYVILSVTKDLLAGYTLSTRVVAGRL